MVAIPVPLEAIEETAREITPGRVLLAAAAWPLYWAGYGFALLMTGFWKCFRFAAASALTGWRTANGPSKRAQILQLKAVVADQKMQLSRVFGPQ